MVTKPAKRLVAVIKIRKSGMFQICVIQARNSDAPVDNSCLDYSVIEVQTRVRLGMVARPAPPPREPQEELDDSWLDEDR